MRHRVLFVLVTAFLGLTNIGGSPRGEFAGPESASDADTVLDASEVFIALTESNGSGHFVHIELRGDGSLRREDGSETGEKATVIEREITDLREIAAYLDLVIRERFFDLPPRISPPDRIRVSRDNRYFFFGPAPVTDATEVTLHVSIGYRSHTVQFGLGLAPEGVGRLAGKLRSMTEAYR